MNPFRADLHVHSIFSDGSQTPQELIELAAQKGFQALSITDHDTIRAYPDSIKHADKAKIRIITGVEFSCMFEGINVHILGYNFSLEGSQIPKLCERHTERRQKRNRAIIEKLQAQNIHVEEKDLIGHQVGRPHIAQVLERRGYVRNLKEAFTRYLAEGKRAYVQGETFSVQETIDVIHADGGKAFLAHPHLLPKRKIWLGRLFELPFDGIECYYARFPIDQEKKWLELANKKELLISGGSDFHGEFKPQNMLGSSWVDEPTFNQIVLGV